MKSLAFILIFAFQLVSFADNKNLSIAVENNDLRKVKKIIESGKATINEIVTSSGGIVLPIIGLAAMSGSEDVAMYLIQNKADLNLRTDAGETPLMMAVFFELQDSSGRPDFKIHDRIARALIDAGADLENPGNYAAVSYAAYKNRVDIIRYMLSKGASPDGEIHDGISVANTGLMMAAMQGHTKTAKLLLENDANVKLKNHTGSTATMLAKKYKQTQLLPMFACAEQLQEGQRFIDHCKF